MLARYLLGPAGSGKTCRCLEEIRARLRAEPEGPPLVMLAPKQATFQLERQLLSDPSLSGYTRLHILSFERLARFILEASGDPERPLLSEQGRVMVLRALLRRHAGELRSFKGAAGMNGFARQLSLDLRELQRHQLAPTKLAALAAEDQLPAGLRLKLRDMALLLKAYGQWIEGRGLGDADALLDLAAEALAARQRSGPVFAGEHASRQGEFLFSAFPTGTPLRIAGLWMDGFAEMAPQELALLAALAPCCDTVTLAFCVEPGAADSSWLSIWSGVHRTLAECRQRLKALPGAREEIVRLPEEHPTRFSDNPVLEHLERRWTRPVAFEGGAEAVRASIRLALCANPRAEAVLAAREILAVVRAGGRFRDTAILVRRMEGYHEDLRRVLGAYGIPFFLDRREAVGHHPLAELLRCALGLAARGWRHDDWFGALKTGLVTEDEAAVDYLENEALEHGWKGAAWLSPLPGARAEKANRLRERWVEPFARLVRDLSMPEPTGRQLAGAIRELWRRLNVEETLEKWAVAQDAETAPAPHETVFTQLNAWLADVELAFGDTPMPLAEWEPVLEAGLAGLTVGVIPPALDQVLVGAVDRSRNPDLKLVMVLGANETVFPATPPEGSLLAEPDRDALALCGIHIGTTPRQWLARERFLGYIACTRARRRLVVAASVRDTADSALNPSPFFGQLRSLFPALEIESFSETIPLASAVHLREIAAPLLQAASGGVPGALEALRLPGLAGLEPLAGMLRPGVPRLSRATARSLCGPVLRVSVSRMEQFAACPFRFFVESGLRAAERRIFELDPREKGSFQHRVLEQFHKRLRESGRRWHDLSAAEARERIGIIADELAVSEREGLLDADAPSRFAARAMKRSLQDFIAVIADWMRQYDFEPEEAELRFGPGRSLPGWELDLGGGNRLSFGGVIDRVDLCPLDDATAFVVVIDYKSSDKKLEKILMDNGLQLQLPAYLSVLRSLGEPEKALRFKRLIPAGVFYVNLNGRFEKCDTRAEALGGIQEAQCNAYRHSGRFDVQALARLDNRPDAREGTQFKYRRTKNGLHKGDADPMAPGDFQAMLDQVEALLRRMGGEIFDGIIALDPYQKGGERACDHCDFAGICRIDPWTHEFRALT